MRKLIHQISRIVIMVCLTMVPIGILVEVMEWGAMPDRFVIAYPLGALFWGFINHFTQPSLESGLKPYEPEDQSPLQDT